MTQSVDPRTGTAFGPVLADTDATTLDAVIDAAATAAPHWAATSRVARAAALSAVADRRLGDAQAQHITEIVPRIGQQRQ